MRIKSVTPEKHESHEYIWNRAISFFSDTSLQLARTFTRQDGIE